MKILHILDHSIPLHSGYTFRTRAILRNQHRLGIETCQVTSPKQGRCDNPIEAYDGLTFYRCPEVTSPWSELPVVNQLAIIPRLKKRILEVIDQEKPDLLHAHSPALNGIAAYQAAKAAGLPLVYEVRAFWEDAAANLGTSREGGVRYRLTRSMETYVLRRADAVTCICEGLKTDIINRGIAADKVTTIPNAVDLEQFHVAGEKNPELLKLYDLEDKQTLGFIGSFYEYEGLDILIRSFERLKNTQPDLRLLLVGGGPQEANLKQLASSLGVEQRVIFVGRVPHQDVAKYYSLVDLLVYPRKSMRLTDLVTPLKPMEAMAQGKAVMASDVGGHRELIRHKENGYLFASDSPPALAKGVEQLINDQELTHKMIENGLNFVNNERNWPNSVERYRPLYEQLHRGRH